MSKNTVLGIVAAVALALVAIFLIRESNDGPLENAAEDLDEAVEELEDGAQ